MTTRHQPQAKGIAPMRLQKFLAHAGVASRRASEELIQAGRVQVNSQTVTELGTKVVPGKDEVRVDGKLITALEGKAYYMLHKPVGYVSTVKDPQGRPTVLSLVDVPERVYPVGRLDFDSEGLLLLTNDGEVAWALTHPSQRVTKRYLVEVEGRPSARDLQSLAQGVMLEDGITAPAEVKLLSAHGNGALIEMGIHEGRNRQIRRMCERIGHRVTKLKRVQMGPIMLGRLPVGAHRPLQPKEVAALRQLVPSEKDNGKRIR